MELTVHAAKSNALGPDELRLSMIKPLLSALTGFLTTLFNRSITDGWSPAIWKKAIIVPINKIAVPMTVSDYRPIALLSPLSKILERLGSDQITQFLEKFSILDPWQCGFRRGHSTATALLKLVNDVRAGMDRRRVTVLVLFDFSKAFETVHHGILLSKLRSMGFDSHELNWVRS